MSDPLPIDALVPEVLGALRAGRDLVVQAEPGAGKTTRLPLVMREGGWADSGEIWVSQPRRIAARMAATRVASLLGESVGGTVGYQVRFDAKTSQATRIRFVTEGILARRLVDDPQLKGIAAVVFDEFHERHLDADLALAMVRALQRGARPDLRVAVMSATLQPGPIAQWLGAVPLFCEGRAYPVTVAYATDKSDRPLDVQVASALRELGRERLDGGSALVFLPGAREIRECQRGCASVADALGLEVVVLHGELPADEQDRAVRPGARAKLVLATNVAETSITIAGVSCVIDSGLVRQASHDPWTGLGTLALARTSKASAEQRAGRAGRTRAGHCVRLFARADFDRRPAFDTPEIHRMDLAGAALSVRAAGFAGLAAVPWFEPPPEPACKAAEELLLRLGAIDAVTAALTDRGRTLLRYPVHPRLARVLQAGASLGVGHAAAGAAALLSERSIRRGGPERSRRAATTASSDVVVDLDDLRAFERDPGRAGGLGLDHGACRTVLEVWRSLARGSKREQDLDEDALGVALLSGFPDRVAAVRPGAAGARRKLAFAGGGGTAELAEDSAVQSAAFVVALQATARREGASGPQVLVNLAAAIEPEWLLELDIDRLEERRVASFDAERERVDAVVETRWDGLLLESRREHEPSEATANALFEAARARGASAWIDEPDALAELSARAAFAHGIDPAIPLLDAGAFEQVLREACNGRRSFAELRRADLLGALLGTLGSARDRFERIAPAHVALDGQRRVRVHYEPDQPPWIESRLQDFFGSLAGPRVAEGRVAVAIRLLAPNHRPVQITTDLAGFWDRHYAEIRKALMRRYPRHDWPEDPRTARPPAPRGRR